VQKYFYNSSRCRYFDSGSVPVSAGELIALEKGNGGEMKWKREEKGRETEEEEREGMRIFWPINFFLREPLS